MLFEITALPPWNNIFTHPVIVIDINTRTRGESGNFGNFKEISEISVMDNSNICINT